MITTTKPYYQYVDQPRPPDVDHQELYGPREEDFARIYQRQRTLYLLLITILFIWLLTELIFIWFNPWSTNFTGILLFPGTMWVIAEVFGEGSTFGQIVKNLASPLDLLIFLPLPINFAVVFVILFFLVDRITLRCPTCQHAARPWRWWRFTGHCQHCGVDLRVRPQER